MKFKNSRECSYMEPILNIFLKKKLVLRGRTGIFTGLTGINCEFIFQL